VIVQSLAIDALVLSLLDQVTGKEAQAGVNDTVNLYVSQTLIVFVTSLKVIASG
jgi:hypothetical protein